MAIQQPKQRNATLILLRSCLIILSLAWGCWVIGMHRTCQFGTTWGNLFFEVLFAGIVIFPVALLAFPGLSLRRTAKGALAISVTSLILIEVYALAQERWVIWRHGPAPEFVVEPRWWPFRNHVIYGVGKSWYGGD